MMLCTLLARGDRWDALSRYTPWRLSSGAPGTRDTAGMPAFYAWHRVCFTVCHDLVSSQGMCAAGLTAMEARTATARAHPAPMAHSTTFGAACGRAERGPRHVCTSRVRAHHSVSARGGGADVPGGGCPSTRAWAEKVQACTGYTTSDEPSGGSSGRAAGMNR